VFRVSGDLVLGGISDQSFGFSESDIRRSSSVSLIIGDNFYSIVLENSYTRVGGSEINSNGGAFNYFFRHFLITFINSQFK
jgi:hypothetical protein